MEDSANVFYWSISRWCRVLCRVLSRALGALHGRKLPYGRLLELAARLEGWERLCIQLAPQRTLERGFSITRDSEGRALRDPGRVRCGERIISQLASGSLASRVEET